MSTKAPSKKRAGATGQPQPQPQSLCTVSSLSDGHSGQEIQQQQAHPNAKAKAGHKPEKRLKRLRSRPPKAVLDRIARARSQRLYLVRRDDAVSLDHPEYGGPSCSFVVLGSTGNVYEVTICKVPSCTCPDHKKGNLCKHILFVLLKVVGLPDDSMLVYQAALLTEELEEVFDAMARRQAGLAMGSGLAEDVLANDAVRRQYQAIAGKGDVDADVKGEDGRRIVRQKDVGIDADCPICFDKMSPAEPLTYCQAACGTNFHADCMKKWSSDQLRRGLDVSCPACRQPWLDEATGGSATRKHEGGAASGDEGYANLGSLQGVSPVRDTSTYSDWYNYSRDDWSRKRRRRRW